jgi:hypothetical protein
MNIFKDLFELLFRKYIRIDIISIIYIIFDDFDILIFKDVNINDFFYVFILNEFFVSNSFEEMY